MLIMSGCAECVNKFQNIHAEEKIFFHLHSFVHNRNIKLDSDQTLGLVKKKPGNISQRDWQRLGESDTPYR